MPEIAATSGTASARLLPAGTQSDVAVEVPPAANGGAPFGSIQQAGSSHLGDDASDEQRAGGLPTAGSSSDLWGTFSWGRGDGGGGGRRRGGGFRAALQKLFSRGSDLEAAGTRFGRAAQLVALPSLPGVCAGRPPCPRSTLHSAGAHALSHSINRSAPGLCATKKRRRRRSSSNSMFAAEGSSLSLRPGSFTARPPPPPPPLPPPPQA